MPPTVSTGRTCAALTGTTASEQSAKQHKISAAHLTDLDFFLMIFSPSSVVALLLCARITLFINSNSNALFHHFIAPVCEIRAVPCLDLFAKITGNT
jgi:hypothetical protein